MLEFLKAPFMVQHFLLYTLMTLLMMLSVILLSILMALLSALSVISHLNLNLIYNTLWTGQEKACWFQWWKNSNNSGAIDVKIDGSVLEEKSSSKMQELAFSSKLYWDSYISLLPELPPRKLELWFVLWSFFPLRLLCICINLPDGNAWNTVFTSGLVQLVATCNC